MTSPPLLQYSPNDPSRWGVYSSASYRETTFSITDVFTQIEHNVERPSSAAGVSA